MTVRIRAPQKKNFIDVRFILRFDRLEAYLEKSRRAARASDQYLDVLVVSLDPPENPVTVASTAFYYGA